MSETTTETFPTKTQYEGPNAVSSTIVEVKVKKNVFPSKLDLESNYSKFQASNEYASATYYTNINNPEVLFIECTMKKEDISAVHIHVNSNGSPGPIIAWLSTTDEWMSGITQNTPLVNYPCPNNSNNGKEMYTLIPPTGTKLVKEMINTNTEYIVKKPSCGSCPWISNGTMLVVHGKKFQQVRGCELIGSAPGGDVITFTSFVQV